MQHMLVKITDAEQLFKDINRTKNVILSFNQNEILNVGRKQLIYYILGLCKD